MTDASKHSWYNGVIGEREQGAPSIASISFHLGTGVFDGLMAYWNGDHYYIHRGEEHFVRFKAGAARMGLEFPYSIDDLMRAVCDLLEHEPKGTQYIRPIAYRRAPELWVTGSEGRPVDVSIFTVRTSHARDINSSLRCHVSPVQRISSLSIPGQTKISGSYVNSFHARRLAERSGFDDGIMLDRKGRVAEASAANVFLLTRDYLITPPLTEDIFPGITRTVILELAPKKGIDVLERDVYPEDLKSIEGAFLCSTLMEIRGLSAMGELALDTINVPAYRAIVDAFRAVTHQ